MTASWAVARNYCARAEKLAVDHPVCCQASRLLFQQGADFGENIEVKRWVDKDYIEGLVWAVAAGKPVYLARRNGQFPRHRRGSCFR